MTQSDCLILGFYDYPFAEYVSMLRAMGVGSGAFQDLSLAFVEINGRPLRALDLLTQFRREAGFHDELYHNADFLWPVVAYLTTYLRRRGLNADYVNLPHLETDRLRRKLAGRPRAVAITTTLYVSPHPIQALVDLVRSMCPDSKIIVGGPYIANQMHTSNRRDLRSLFDYLGADIYVTCTEGEETLSCVLRALKAGEPLDFLPNLAFRNASKNFTFTIDAPESNALQENVIDYAPFFEESPSEFLSIRTAKSCPFACAFCGFPERAGEYRFLDLASVERQLDLIRDLGRVTTITFLDDTFNVPRGRFKDILRMMIRNRYGFRWNCFYRADHGDSETIELMGRAGCEGVFLGVESGSDHILSLMNKAARRRHYADAIPQLHAAGISTYASLIVGFPGETDDTVRETIDFLEESAPEYFRAQLWYADPVTPIWKEREKFRIEGVGFDWKHYTMSVCDACQWIERIFMNVKNSTWLPQFGFEQWSTFYLARKGMSRAQIRSFVIAFNDIIKHRLLSPLNDPPEELLDRARQCAIFQPAFVDAASVACAGSTACGASKQA